MCVGSSKSYQQNRALKKKRLPAGQNWHSADTDGRLTLCVGSVIPLIRNAPSSSRGDESLCLPHVASSNAALGTDGAVLPKATLSGSTSQGLNLAGRSDWQASRWLLDHSSLQSVALCGMTVCDETTAGISRIGVQLRDGKASFSGLKRCGSVWSCPTCAARLWSERREELEHIVSASCGKKLTVAMLTLTLAHNNKQSLEELLKALSLGWRKSQQQRGVRDAAAELGVVGFVRRTEVTHGYQNGWHPHLHILVFAEGGAGKRAWDNYAKEIQKVWKATAIGQGLKAPSAKRGLDLKVFEFRGKHREYAEEIVSHYLTKGGTFLGAAAEFTDFEGKRAKNGNRTSWELLAQAMSGRSSAIARWHTYEKETAGNRAWAVSKSLRELAKEHPLEIEDAPEQHCVGFIRNPGWQAMIRDRRDLGQLLTDVEKAWARGLTKGAGEEAALLAAAQALEDRLKSWGVGKYFTPVERSSLTFATSDS